MDAHLADFEPTDLDFSHTSDLAVSTHPILQDLHQVLTNPPSKFDPSSMFENDTSEQVTSNEVESNPGLAEVDHLSLERQRGIEDRNDQTDSSQKAKHENVNDLISSVGKIKSDIKKRHKKTKPQLRIKLSCPLQKDAQTSGSENGKKKTAFRQSKSQKKEQKIKTVKGVQGRKPVILGSPSTLEACERKKKSGKSKSGKNVSIKSEKHEKDKVKEENVDVLKSRRSLRLKDGKKVSYYVNESADAMNSEETPGQKLSPTHGILKKSSSAPSSSESQKNKSRSEDTRLVASSNGYKCYLCEFTSRSRVVLKQHREVCHGEKPFCCSHCSYSCKNRSDLTKHEQIHVPDNHFKCPHCDYAGKRLKYLKKHMKLHGFGSAFSCHLCVFHCDSKDILNQHLKDHVTLKPLECEHCGQGFKQKEAYRKHLASHSDVSPFMCAVCGATFKKKVQLEKHKAKHKTGDDSENWSDEGSAEEEMEEETEDEENVGEDGKVKPLKISKLRIRLKLKTMDSKQEVGDDDKKEEVEVFHCESCTYSTTQRALLRSHKRKHSELKPYVCQHCGAAFKRGYHLTRHKLSHNADAPKFPCPHCPYSTFRKHRLKVHILTHQTNKPIKCSLCPYSCRHEWTLKYHMRKHTGNTQPGKSGQPAQIDFTCHLCGYQCTNTKNMRYHMKRHENKTPHSCPHCDYKCSSKSSIKDHLLQHAGLKPYLCPDCGKSFRNASRLSRHKLVHSNVKPYSCQFCDFSSRSRYNLRQHILRHTDKEKIKKRIRNKHSTNPVTVDNTSKSNSDTASTGTLLDSQPFKSSYQTDLQSLLGQISGSSLYLDNNQSDQSYLMPGMSYDSFPNLGLTTPSTQGVAASSNNLTTKSFPSNPLTIRENMLEASKENSIIQSSRTSNLPGAPPGLPNLDLNSDSFNTGPNTVPAPDFDISQGLSGFGSMSAHNDPSLAAPYNPYPHLPPPPPHPSTTSNFPGSYNYMNSYFYNETVFPNYMSSNMNIYLGQGGMEGMSHLGSGLDLRRACDSLSLSGINAMDQTATNKLPTDITMTQVPTSLDRIEPQPLGNIDTTTDHSTTQSSVIHNPPPSYVESTAGRTHEHEVNHHPFLMTKDSQVDNSVASTCVSVSDSAQVVNKLGNDTNTNLPFSVLALETEHEIPVESLNADLAKNKDLEGKVKANVEENHVENNDENNMVIDNSNDDDDDDDTDSYQLPEDEAEKDEENVEQRNEEDGERDGEKEIEQSVQRSPFFCTECGQMCESRAMLQRHRRTHVNEKPHTCEHCGKAFRRKDHLRAHLHTHSEEKPFKCSMCDYACNRKYRLNRHELSHTEEKSHKCQACGKSFDTDEELSDHSKLHEEGYMYACDVDSCDFKCKVKSELNAHSKVHQTFLCEKCSYSCTSAAEFSSHKRVHHQEKKEMTCHICNYVCDSSKRLKYHMARHENKTPHSCPHCDYKCSSRSSLTDHLLNHEGIKPFLCSICGMRFRNTSRLNRHKLVHSDVKPHSCSYCTFSSRSKYNLKQHMLRHFKNDNNNPTDNQSQKKDRSLPPPQPHPALKNTVALPTSSLPSGLRADLMPSGSNLRPPEFPSFPHHTLPTRSDLTLPPTFRHDIVPMFPNFRNELTVGLHTIDNQGF